MKELHSLYNGIMNDYSIRKYSLGWRDIIAKLESRYKTIPKTDEQFENKMLISAALVTKGALRKDIEGFARELSISMETLREKSNRGTQRSPFGIGS